MSVQLCSPKSRRERQQQQLLVASQSCNRSGGQQRRSTRSRRKRSARARRPAAQTAAAATELSMVSGAAATAELQHGEDLDAGETAKFPHSWHIPALTHLHVHRSF